MGYLGLALLESGDPARARGWFERAGSDQMVARCDALLAEMPAEELAARGGGAAPEPPPAEPAPGQEPAAEPEPAAARPEAGRPRRSRRCSPRGRTPDSRPSDEVGPDR